jgi:hypothetical protein
MITKSPPTHCLFCDLHFVTVPATKGTRYHAKCRRCGSHAVSYAEHDAMARRLQHEHRPVFSQWIYEKNRLGEVPTVDLSDIGVIASRQRFSFVERARRLLLYVYENTVTPGDPVDILYLPLQAALQIFDTRYIDNLAHHLQDEKLATVGLPGQVQRDADQTQMVTLTPRGNHAGRGMGPLVHGIHTRLCSNVV